MSSIEPRQALYAHLRADPGVQAAVGDRVYQRRVPPGAMKPLIVIWPPISRVPVRDLAEVAWQRTRIQLTAIADTQSDVEVAAKAAINAVEGFSGLMAGALEVMEARVQGDRQVDQDEVDEVYHHIDVIITYFDKE